MMQYQLKDYYGKFFGIQDFKFGKFSIDHRPLELYEVEAGWVIPVVTITKVSDTEGQVRFGSIGKDSFFSEKPFVIHNVTVESFAIYNDSFRVILGTYEPKTKNKREVIINHRLNSYYNDWGWFCESVNILNLIIEKLGEVKHLNTDIFTHSRHIANRLRKCILNSNEFSFNYDLLTKLKIESYWYRNLRVGKDDLYHNIIRIINVNDVYQGYEKEVLIKLASNYIRSIDEKRGRIEIEFDEDDSMFDGTNSNNIPGYNKISNDAELQRIFLIRLTLKISKIYDSKEHAHFEFMNLYESLCDIIAIVDEVNSLNNKITAITNQSKKITFQQIKDELHVGDFIIAKRELVDENNVEKVEFREIQKVNKKDAIGKFESEIAVIDEVNDFNQSLHFITSSKLEGEFGYAMPFLLPKVGDLVMVRFVSLKDKIVYVLDIERTEESNKNLRKEIKGLLIMQYKNRSPLVNGSEDDEDDYEEEYNDEGDYENEDIELTDEMYDENGRLLLESIYPNLYKDHTSSKAEHIMYPDFALIEDYSIPKSLLEKHLIWENCEANVTFVRSREDWKAISLERI